MKSSAFSPAVKLARLLRPLRRWLDQLDPPPPVTPQDGGPRPTVPR